MVPGGCMAMLASTVKVRGKKARPGSQDKREASAFGGQQDHLAPGHTTFSYESAHVTPLHLPQIPALTPDALALELGVT